MAHNVVVGWYGLVATGPASSLFFLAHAFCGISCWGTWLLHRAVFAQRSFVLAVALGFRFCSSPRARPMLIPSTGAPPPSILRKQPNLYVGLKTLRFSPSVPLLDSRPGGISPRDIWAVNSMFSGLWESLIVMFAGIDYEYSGRTSQFKASFIPACRQNIFIAWICESRIPSEAPADGST